MCRPKGYFLRPFGLKTSTNFAHVGLESGMVFEETTGVRTYLLFHLQKE